MNPVVGLGVLALLLVVVSLLLLAFRPFVLWYFKIDERTALLTEIRDSLRRAESARSTRAPDDRLPWPAATDPSGRRPADTEDEFNSRVASQHLGS
jgi:hypothetical protein